MKLSIYELRAAIILVTTIYVASLFFPPFHCAGEMRSMSGFNVLFFGWVGLFTKDPGWFANILFFIMIYHMLYKRTRNLIFPLLATLLSISTLFPSGAGCEGEIGPSYTSASVSLSLSGYLWVASIVLGSLIYSLRHKTVQYRVLANPYIKRDALKRAPYVKR